MFFGSWDLDGILMKLISNMAFLWVPRVVVNNNGTTNSRSSLRNHARELEKRCSARCSALENTQNSWKQHGLPTCWLPQQHVVSERHGVSLLKFTVFARGMQVCTWPPSPDPHRSRALELPTRRPMPSLRSPRRKKVWRLGHVKDATKVQKMGGELWQLWVVCFFLKTDGFLMCCYILSLDLCLICSSCFVQMVHVSLDLDVELLGMVNVCCCCWWSLQCFTAIAGSGVATFKALEVDTIQPLKSMKCWTGNCREVLLVLLVVLVSF